MANPWAVRDLRGGGDIQLDRIAQQVSAQMPIGDQQAAGKNPVVKAEATIATGDNGDNETAETSASADIDRTQFCLMGKCPVTLMKEGRWQDGDPTFGIVHRDRTYLFASEAALNEFRSDPDVFSPLLAGYDPVLYHDGGELVDGLPKHGVFMGRLPNQRVVLFSNPTTRATFQANPQQYLETVRQAMNTAGPANGNVVR